MAGVNPGERHNMVALNLLRQKAIAFKNTDAFINVAWFYRDKDPEYFSSILQGDGIMRGSIKDNNGDPRSPINGRLRGVFFGVNVNYLTSEPIEPAMFGSRRLLIPAHLMFDLAPNIYFADFFCMYSTHYVTLVMTRPGSAADTFCRLNLLPLDPHNNPFLRQPYIAGGPAQMCMGNLWLEVFVTEDIDIPFMLGNRAEFKDVPQRPIVYRDGIPKNPLCAICNI